jgi:acyl transferase domain-containing protein/SAM-dependent methyltransferase/acyl carrier protein
MRRGNGNGNGATKPRRFEPIAIIGMRGRFPGANDLDAYWQNLAHGVESIAILTPAEMHAAGVPDHICRLPGYVNASPVLDGVDQFDAEFFGFSARDASLTDPQHRLFLETAWETLEDAGYDPASYSGAIGVFGGCELSTYLYQLYLNIDSLKYIDGMQLMVTNDKDHLCTQVAYRLNLRGPSVTVQTTCSTSLVAISLACESLHARSCDMALAGGVTVRVPQRAGYFYTAGSILSPDGHCRPFDANAQGTIVGSGVGLVALKRLDDALASRDNLRAIILGVGLNNDGNDKVGYTAPSFRGQAAAIRAAHVVSSVSPESIGYVEAHGTGTILGDPIEFSALTEVFKEKTERRGFCGIGSVKSNFGHLSCAAGVAGLIKTVLTIERGAIPPTLHYTAPNPAIDFASSPFYVANTLRPWNRDGAARRAGVSSFGVGGTNAHVVLEEAPGKRGLRKRRPYQLLLLSARTEAALDNASANLAAHLRTHPELDLADVAFTLHVGRRGFRHRRVLVVDSDDRGGVIARLSEPECVSSAVAVSERPVVFMFPGQGSQYPAMGAELYESEPVVHKTIDRCARLLEPALGADLRRILFPGQRRRKGAVEVLKSTRWAQPALFTIGYALSELWRSWGIQPNAMIGHSVGEYVAATVAKVMTLKDALRLIAERGRLISSLPRGSMLAVMASTETVERFVDNEVSLAAVNAPGLSVLSGPDRAIERVESVLVRQSIASRRLHTSHAFHSAMMEPILAEFEDLIADVKLSAPSIPFIATMTGEWADGTVTQPKYWTAQLRSAVRFADGVRAIADSRGRVGKDAIYLELGPGNTLVTFANQIINDNGKLSPCLMSLPGPKDRRSETEVILSTLGQLWANGVVIDWEGFHKTERRARVSLPTYPFERQSYWIGPRSDATTGAHEPRDTSSWFYRSVWREGAAPEGDQSSLNERRILVFDEQTGLGAGIIDRLRAVGAQPIVARQGDRFQCINDHTYTLDPSEPDNFRQLAARVCDSERRLAGVIDCWTAAPAGNTDLNTAATISLLSPMRLVHALSNHSTVRPLPVLLVARGSARVYDDDVVDPPRALGIGPARVLPQEHPGLRLAHVDVDSDSSVPELVVAEFAADAPEPTVAFRKGRRFVADFEPAAIDSINPPHKLPEHPVVFVTGGLGHMGLSLAEALYAQTGARLVLVGRGVLPEPSEWAAKSDDQTVSPDLRRVLARLAALREERDDVLVLTADFNNAVQVGAAADAAIAHFGQIDLVIHGAARIDPAAFASAAESGPAVVDAQFSPKLHGLYYLINALRGREPCRWVLHSSISTVLGGLGLAVYSGANAVLDAIALAGGDRWLSIDWDAWDNAGEAGAPGMPVPIYPPEGQEVFLRLLGAEVGSRALVVVGDLTSRLNAWVRYADAEPEKTGEVERHPRPNLATPFIEPRTATERGLAEIWGAQLGVASVGVHDRFFDLGGHSLLAVQVASEIHDRFEIDIPVLKLFQAPTVAELAVLIDKAKASGSVEEEPTKSPKTDIVVPAATPLGEDAVGAAKAGYREFYNDVTRRLERSGVGEASFFLNYGYVSQGEGDEARFEVASGVFNPSSVRLAFEVIGGTDLRDRRVLDVGCGRGGTVALMVERFQAKATGVDLAPEAIAFCRRTHLRAAGFEVGDAEHLPFDDGSFDVVVNIESSHTYPNLRAFFSEVGRVLISRGEFLYADLLPVQRWAEVKILLSSLSFTFTYERNITANVLASCDEVAATRAQAFGEANPMIDNFLAVPGSAVYEQMQSGAWEYRIVRARCA